MSLRWWCHASPSSHTLCLGLAGCMSGPGGLTIVLRGLGRNNFGHLLSAIGFERHPHRAGQPTKLATRRGPQAPAPATTTCRVAPTLMPVARPNLRQATAGGLQPGQGASASGHNLGLVVKHEAGPKGCACKKADHSSSKQTNAGPVRTYVGGAAVAATAPAVLVLPASTSPGKAPRPNAIINSAKGITVQTARSGARAGRAQRDGCSCGHTKGNIHCQQPHQHHPHLWS
jgi:hypothetical protein